MKATTAFLFLLPLTLTQGCSGPGTLSSEDSVANEPTFRASLGLSTRAPSETLVNDLGLVHRVRIAGREITEVELDGAADRAGLRAGDVLLRMDDNDLYSSDDVQDYLHVSSPGREVSIAYKRTTAEVRTASLTLGKKSKEAQAAASMSWHFASLGQLPQALDAARAEKKRLLVGLSGAET